jgi:hypothetical protein
MSADRTREDRQSYEPPVLLRFGTLTNLTTGGSAGVAEGKAKGDTTKVKP